MNKIIIILPIIFFLESCSNLQFVYKKSPELERLYQSTLYDVSGDNSDEIRSIINQKLDKSNKSGKYVLNINSKKTTSKIVTQNDKTASGLEIRFTITYKLKDNIKKCQIYEKSLITQSSYNMRSSSYNFGSDIAVLEISKKIIDSNIGNFFDDLILNYNTEECLNEN